MTRILLLVFLTGCSSAALRSPADVGAGEFASLPAGGRIGLHGMVLYGAGPYFLDHIPMTKQPHDFQIVAEVTMEETSGTKISDDFSKATFTVEPDTTFSLNDYLAGRLIEFNGTIFTGGFEQGGKPRTKDVHFTVKAIRFARHLPSTDGPPSLEMNDGKNVYRINIIKPDTAHNIQMIENEGTGKRLWCVIGDDFSEPCR